MGTDCRPMLNAAPVIIALADLMIAYQIGSIRRCPSFVQNRVKFLISQARTSAVPIAVCARDASKQAVVSHSVGGNGNDGGGYRGCGPGRARRRHGGLPKQYLPARRASRCLPTRCGCWPAIRQIDAVEVVIHPDDRALYEAAARPFAARLVGSGPGRRDPAGLGPPRARGAGAARARSRADPRRRPPLPHRRSRHAACLPRSMRRRRPSRPSRSPIR